MSLSRINLLLMMLPLLATGCLGWNRSGAMFAVETDFNKYLRPSMSLDRYSHDSSSRAQINHYRWLHPTGIGHVVLPEKKLSASAVLQTPVPHQSGPALPPQKLPPVPPEVPSSPIEITIPPEFTPPE